MLGVESGTCLVDFTGEVENWCREFEQAHPEADHLSEEFYLEAHHTYLHQFEGNFKYLHLSPRHLEAAATRSLQILYEGEYSGILHSGRHFLPLRRDLANFPEVVDFLRDDRRVSEMVERAYEEIVLDRRTTLHQFCRAVRRGGRAGGGAQGQRRCRRAGGRPAARARAGGPRTDDRSAHRMDGGGAD